MSLNIRPRKIIEAAMWLLKKSDLYKEEGVVFNENWISEYNEESLSLSQDESDSVGEPELSDSHIENKADSSHLSEEDHWSEDEAENIAGVTDTMLTPPDFLESGERQSILNVAPAEGSRPLSLFGDKYCEELAYPGIFLGQKQQDNKDRSVKVQYSDICKSELRRSDRRAAMNVENISFKAKKLQMKILLGKSNVALRKCKNSKNDSLRAGNLKQEGALERLIHHDEGFKFLRGCLSKNHPLNFAPKIILSKTLATERLYQGYKKNRFGLIQNYFLVALEAKNYFVRSAPAANVSKCIKLAFFVALKNV